VKLLLNESIKNVGKVGDVVEVSPGFARNYLLPKGLAVQPTPQTSSASRPAARRSSASSAEKRRPAAGAMIKQLPGPSK
jgi:large subunit ribosomal protein L9